MKRCEARIPAKEEAVETAGRRPVVREIRTITPSKRPEVKVKRRHPYNAETPLGLLRGSFLTPNDLFYVRSHGAVPHVDPGAYRLSICGMVDEPLTFSLEDLKSGFPRTEVVATLYCAGNRRRELMAVSSMPGKLPWDAGAAGNARWGGILLQNVLQAAGYRKKARHVAFEGLDTDMESGTGARYGGSIPVEKALMDDVLLTYEMNGEPLPPEHGFPLRAIVGGYVGARSVKWLSEVSVQETPSDNYYQAREYRLFPSGVTAETADLSGSEPLGELPLNAVICVPEEGDMLRTGATVLKGYALAGGARRPVRVEVSPNGGRTWVEATLSARGADGLAAWLFWEAEVELEAGPCQLLARASDNTAEIQPGRVEDVWNFQGYANNAWHRVEVRAGGRE
jgi:sulfite oxidase